MRLVTVGVVGCGYWGPNLIRNFQNDDRAQVKYACDLKPELLDKLRKNYGATVLTSDFNDLLKDSELDAIAISTPVHTHFSLARQALLAGKHVLIEKPMCMSSPECLELIALSEEKKRIIMVDHTFVYHGPIRCIKRLMEANQLGKLLYFNSVRVNLGAFQNDINVLWDLAVHDLSIMDYLVGQTPLTVHAVGAAHALAGLEDIAFLTLEFEDQFIAHFHVSWLSPVKIRQTFIGGTAKMIVLNDAAQFEKVKLYDKGIEAVDVNEQERYKQLIQYRYGDMHAPVYDLTEALRVETAHFIDCVINGTKPITDGQSGLRVVRLLELAGESLATRSTQPVTAMRAN